jgi:hypothetical protein
MTLVPPRRPWGVCVFSEFRSSRTSRGPPVVRLKTTPETLPRPPAPEASHRHLQRPIRSHATSCLHIQPARRRCGGHALPAGRRSVVCMPTHASRLCRRVSGLRGREAEPGGGSVAHAYECVRSERRLGREGQAATSPLSLIDPECFFRVKYFFPIRLEDSCPSWRNPLSQEAELSPGT